MAIRDSPYIFFLRVETDRVNFLPTFISKIFFLMCQVDAMQKFLVLFNPRFEILLKLVIDKMSDLSYL